MSNRFMASSLSRRTDPHTSAPIRRVHQVRAVGRSAVHLDVLTQAEKRQDRQDDHDKTDEVDDIVHVYPLRMGSRIEASAPRAS